eukprot:2483465-Pyramimonas_sp.AAC.1
MQKAGYLLEHFIGDKIEYNLFRHLGGPPRPPGGRLACAPQRTGPSPRAAAPRPAPPAAY